MLRMRVSEAERQEYSSKDHANLDKISLVPTPFKKSLLLMIVTKDNSSS